MPTYEALPANNTPEFRELARQLGDALGPIAATEGRLNGAPNANDAFALLAQYSPADRMRLTRGMLRITGGDNGDFLASLNDNSIMFFLTRKFMNAENGRPSMAGLEQALRLFSDMPITATTTANLNYVIQNIILEENPKTFTDRFDEDTQRRIGIFFNGTGIQEEDRGNPYQRLRLIGIIPTPGRRPTVPVALLVAPALLDGPPAMAFDQAMARMTFNTIGLLKLNAAIGGINVGGNNTTFTSISITHTQAGGPQPPQGEDEDHPLVVTPLVAPTVLVV